MKRFLCLILAMLLLTGCAGKPTVEPGQTESEPKGLYDETYPLEELTGGAVRAYPLETNCYTDVYTMGSKILLLGASGEALVMHSDEGVVSAVGVIDGFRYEAASFEVSVEGIANYLPESREVFLLNPMLEETYRVQLPEDIQGEPVISMKSNEIFFCRNGEIRAMNMENGVARLIKSHLVTEQTLDGCYYDGKMLCCTVKDETGNERQIYLSAENGITVGEDSFIYGFETFQNRHFVRRVDNRLDQIIVGTQGGESKLLTVENADFVSSALAMNGALSYQKQADGVMLSFHDLEQGVTTAQVKLTGVGEPVAMGADQKYAWILVEEIPQAENPVVRQVLLRWDITKSAIQETVPVLSTLYTLANPDTEGLKLCKEKAGTLNDTYGVRAMVWEDAVKNTGDYKAVAEYQPVIIEEMLAALEPALQSYPEGFLRKTVKAGWVRIGLVRRIESGEDWVQFWQDGDCYLLISSYADIPKALLEAMGYTIDSRVLGNSRKYDNWSELNPDGFLYTAEAEGQTQDVAGYIDGENRAFVNMEAVVSPTEDRRQIFIAAMVDGNEAVFSSQTMQAKLRRMCEGIREAYGMTNKKEVFRWERYLHEPLVELEESNG